jgi:hypothetical protein
LAARPAVGIDLDNVALKVLLAPVDYLFTHCNRAAVAVEPSRSLTTVR